MAESEVGARYIRRPHVASKGTLWSCRIVYHMVAVVSIVISAKPKCGYPSTLIQGRRMSRFGEPLSIQPADEAGFAGVLRSEYVFRLTRR